jgi:hypothetical protein
VLVLMSDGRTGYARRVEFGLLAPGIWWLIALRIQRIAVTRGFEEGWMSS